MRSLLIGCLFSVFCVVAVTSPVVASEQPEESDDSEASALQDPDGEVELPSSCAIQVVEAGVACVDDRGEEFWRTHHPAMWEYEKRYVERRDPDPEDGPFELQDIEVTSVGERYFYFVKSDLLEVDARPQQQLDDGEWAGGIVGRVRFPASIAEIQQADDESLEITLEVRIEEGLGGEPEETHPFKLRYTLDAPPPAQTQWSHHHDMFAAGSDAYMLGRDHYDEDDPTAAIQWLKEAQRLDSTNPFYAFEYGKLYREMGEEDSAHQAFETSANLKGVHWQDLMHLSAVLEYVDEPALGDQVFERALDKMEQAGIANDRIWPLATLILLYRRKQLSYPDKTPLERAVSEGDVETVQRLSLRRLKLAPNVEHGAQIWTLLANWMAAQGRDDLAEEWRTHAERNHQANELLVGRSATIIDYSLLAFVATFLGLILICLLVGLRGGVARRRELDDRGEDGPAGPRWIPKLGLRDVVVPLILLAVLAVLPFMLNTHSAAVGEVFATSMSPADDSLASPSVERWLDGLAESPAQQELAAIASAEREAIAAGDPIEQKELVFELINQAVVADARQEQLSALRSARVPNVLASSELAGVEATGFESGNEATLGVIHALFVVSGVAILIFVGGLVGVFVPRVSRWVLRIVPGGSATLAPVSALLLVALIAALFAIAGGDAVLRQVLMDTGHGIYFELDGLHDYYQDFAPPRLWAWLTILVVAVVHVAIFMLDWRRD